MTEKERQAADETEPEQFNPHTAEQEPWEKARGRPYIRRFELPLIAIDKNALSLRLRTLGLHLASELAHRVPPIPLYSRAFRISVPLVIFGVVAGSFFRDLLPIEDWVFVLAVCALMFWSWFLGRRSIYAARVRFFVHAQSALMKLYDRTYPEGDKVGALDSAGRAARALFVYLQGSRMTWKTPPAIADRAFRLAYPLINIELTSELRMSEHGRHDLAWLLHDIVAVVHLGVPDLTPRIRESYPRLPTRHKSSDEIPERDMLYLDPMRNRNRWEVFKDYVFPLAAWFSLAISITSLVITLQR
ncbi:MAG: hypothetical protein GEV28_27810 [Actinophytocola sp.]|uniref:hypothetical protein n=1 Tax=Actinophytocola sp. TaxID=1872138 RepID=UPI001321D04C|nr:hypothetical protein [Actinophytocola sp.]MPZ83992.1 hypothetical protein [Actinophytocola sp.]